MLRQEIFSVEQKLVEYCINNTPNIISAGAFDAVVAILTHKEFANYEKYMKQIWTDPSVLPLLCTVENKIKIEIEKEIGIETHPPDFSAAMRFVKEASIRFPKG